jgi:hypothetical protein
MKKLTPDEIQQIAENEISGPEGPKIAEYEKDVEAYRLVFELLDEGPDISLSYGFIAKLSRRISAATDRRISLKWYVFSAVLVCLAFGISYLFISIYDFRAAQQFISFIDQFKWGLSFTTAAFLTIQYFDRRLNTSTQHAENIK